MGELMMKDSINFNLNRAPYTSLEGLSPREIILKLKHYSFLERSYALRQLSLKVRLAVFLAMDSGEQVQLLETMPTIEALRLAAVLPLRVWVSLATILPPALFKELRRALPAQKRRLLLRILALPANGSGRLLCDDPVVVNAGTEVSALLRLLKRIHQKDDRTQLICLVSGDGRYLGTVQATALVTAQPHLPVEQLLEQPVPTVFLHIPQSQAARLMRRHGLSILPVVDEGGRLIGVIRYEDLPCFQHSAGMRRLAAWLLPIAGVRAALSFSLPLAIVAMGLLLTAQKAEAVRPFVTDDARIVDVGQVETETWFETVYADNEFNPAPAFNVMGGTTVNEWLEIIIGSGIGRDANNRVAIPNPLIQPKVLFLRAEKDGRPGFAMGAGTTFDTGRGDLHDPGMSSYLIGMTTWRRFDDWLQIHVNYGPRMDKARGGSIRIRPYWGIGFDIGTFSKDIRFIIESFAGDPLIFESPKYAGQFGFRWLVSNYVNLDLTFGLEPELDEHRRTTGSIETTAQLGIRLLFDAYTPGGIRGDPMGAQGMFPR
jgi:CBS domain-containing protein